MALVSRDACFAVCFKLLLSKDLTMYFVERNLQPLFGSDHLSTTVVFGQQTKTKTVTSTVTAKDGSTRTTQASTSDVLTTLTTTNRLLSRSLFVCILSLSSHARSGRANATQNIAALVRYDDPLKQNMIPISAFLDALVLEFRQVRNRYAALYQLLS